MNQERKQPEKRSNEATEWDVAPEDMPQNDGAKQERDAETEAVLDEIDAVLESNAEEFVRGFVQKGGQ